ncbi:hypothetical protein HN011_004351 [Eciton burchellii]|nr:hypothetical protein HN011_004351 [Eciton burchellii]
MANYARYVIVIIIVVVVGVVCGQTFNSLKDTDGNILKLNVLYDKRLDNEPQSARLLLVILRTYHSSKRNSELINSLLGLPKNIHNAGK